MPLTFGGPVGSTLTIQLDVPDWPQPVRLGVVGTDHRSRTVIARSAPMHEPHSVGAMKKAVGLLVTAWFEPELASDPENVLHDLFEALTAPA